MSRPLDDRSLQLRPQFRWVAVPALLALGALSACGGDSTSASDAPSEVASLDAEAGSGGSDDEEVALAPDEAALEFSQCLRDAGLDVADIGVNADGGIDLRGALDNIDRGDSAVREAFESCSDLLSDVGFGGGGALRGSEEFQDALLAVTDCVRGEGFENATEPGQPGGAGQTGGTGQPGEAGGGQPNGGAGAGQRDEGARGSRLATQMGLDSEDPAVVAAVDTCLPILDDVLAGVESAGDD